MYILAVNTGSSSIKYRLFEAEKGTGLKEWLRGSAERIGQEESQIKTVKDKQTQTHQWSLPDHETAIQLLCKEITKSIGPIQIEAIGHRIVHGGEKYSDSVLIDKDVLQSIREAARFAPLHSQPNILGIEVLQKMWPASFHVAVFDTAAHTTLKPKAFLYGLPIEYYENYGIRKYGFHGINHAYVAHVAAERLGKPLANLKVITCHLGSGCSITAFQNGKSIDTSMGMTPLEGVLMGTRSGDLDPEAVLYLIEGLGMQVEAVNELLNKKSGLLGLCGQRDMRDILSLAAHGDTACQVALEVFVYRIQKYVGAYIAALNGVDLIVFTGGIGENSAEIRARALANFSYVGASLDPDKNQANQELFSAENSAIVLMNIAANEEEVIAEQTFKIVNERKG